MSGREQLAFMAYEENLDCTVVFAINQYYSASGLHADVSSDDSMHGRYVWVIGIFLFLGGCLSNVFGMNMIRKAHQKHKQGAGQASGEAAAEPASESDAIAESAKQSDETAIQDEDEPKLCFHMEDGKLKFDAHFVVGWFLCMIMTAVLDTASCPSSTRMKMTANCSFSAD